MRTIELRSADRDLARIEALLSRLDPHAGEVCEVPDCVHLDTRAEGPPTQAPAIAA